MFSYWMLFSFGASDVTINNNVCSMEYKGQRREFPIQIINEESDGFLYNKETFENKITGQITDNYMSVVDATKAKKVLSKYKNHITKTETGNMEVPEVIANEAVHMVRFESYEL